MLIKRNYYKLALVSVALLMLVGTAGAVITDSLTRTDSSTGTIIINYNSNDNICDQKCCLAPALKETAPATALREDRLREDRAAFLKVNATVNPTTKVRDYLVTNVGDAPLRGVEVMGTNVVPETLRPGDSVEIDTLVAPKLLGRV